MDFSTVVGIQRPEAFRRITRAHVIAWRKDVERRPLAPSTLRRKLSALSSLFEYLYERNAARGLSGGGILPPLVIRLA